MLAASFMKNLISANTNSARSIADPSLTQDGTPKEQTRKHDDLAGVFSIDDGPNAQPDKEEDRRIQGVLERLHRYGVKDIGESNVRYAIRLTKYKGEGEAAFRLLMLLQETYDGMVRPYNRNGTMSGAVNREGVTCYLDSLLFAMFARLDSFEAMLYDNFEDARRKRLAALLRLWVNMLRSGRLITTDVTRRIQDALAKCGWADAAMIKQQDPSEAFAFITGQLKLPLLTLKMDLYHTGKEDPQDDHKFINERLLEVAILDQPLEGSDVITLEDCLENYFNNRVEVKRHLENQRHNSLKSGATSSFLSPEKAEKEPAIHVETVEVTGVPDSPIAQTPTVETPTPSRDPVEKLRPNRGRKRQDSIFSQRKVELVGVDPSESKGNADPQTTSEPQDRKPSAKTEVLMPAWQFFKLLPWYTDHMPTSDAQVAAHFSKKRPVLGICLKRYSYTTAGQATRNDAYVDIPLEITVPHFVDDEQMQEDGPLAGNFRLLLQSVVCHRGVSVHSGHYISLCRGQASQQRDERMDGEDVDDLWMRFDDLARERVSPVDIIEALKKETPYLLFYQVQPIGDDGESIPDLPSYAEATSRTPSDAIPSEKPYLHDPRGSDFALENPSTQPLLSNHHRGPEATEWATQSERTSLDAGVILEGPRGRLSLQDDLERRSIGIDDSNFVPSVSSNSIRTGSISSLPTSPVEEKRNNSSGFLGLPHGLGSQRGSRPSKSRNTSHNRPEGTATEGSVTNRLGLSMSKLTQRISRSDGQQNAEAPSSVRPPSRSDAITSSIPDPASTITQDPGPQLDHDLPSAAASTATNGSDLAGPSEPPPKFNSKKDKAAARQDRRGKSGRGNNERDCTVM